MRFAKTYTGGEVTVLRHKANKHLFFKHFDPCNDKSYTSRNGIQHPTTLLPVITTEDVHEAWTEKVYFSSDDKKFSHHFEMKEYKSTLFDDFEVVFVSYHTESIFNVSE